MKIDLLFICCLLGLLPTLNKGIYSLQLNRLIVDSPAKNGSLIRLYCDFELDKEEQRFYTIKYYKNNVEFYRYSRSETWIQAKKKFYPQPGIHVNMEKSNGSHVYLENIELISEGTYSCEINTDEPYFMSVQAQEDLRVYVLPNEKLKLNNVKNNYREGDLVNVECISAPSKPAVVLIWLINGQQIESKEDNLNISYQTIQLDQDLNGLSYVKSNLTFVLCGITKRCSNSGRKSRLNRFLKLKGNVQIKCVSILSQIVGESFEELVIEEKGLHKKYDQTHFNKQLKPPHIEGLNAQYKIGDQLKLNCTTKPWYPVAYLEWFLNNRRIHEQYVINYGFSNSSSDHEFRISHYLDDLANTENNSNDIYLPDQVSNINKKKSTTKPFNRTKFKPNSMQTRKPSSSNASSSSSTLPTTETLTNFRNDYLFSNNLKNINLLSRYYQNRNQTINLLDFTFNSNLNKLNNSLLLLKLDRNNQMLSSSKIFNNHHKQLPNIYNNNVNLTKLMNNIYKHYAVVTQRPLVHKLGLHFTVEKKHYQTLDFAMRIKCVATYGKIIEIHQIGISLFSDGHTNSYMYPLETNGVHNCEINFLLINICLFIIRKQIHHLIS